MPVYIDLGIPTVEDFWNKIVIPNVEQYRSEPLSPMRAFNSALATWHLHDWIWDERHPGPDKKTFQDAIVAACPELGLLRDIGDATKHRRLDRPTVKATGVKEVSTAGGGLIFLWQGPKKLMVTSNSGTTQDFADVLAVAVEYCRVTWFPNHPPV